LQGAPPIRTARKEARLIMARIIVQTDTDPGTIMLDEREVDSEVIKDEHASSQLMERIVWAIQDIERSGV
jgi:hypothetical protein